jgi:hypothetical protein
MARWVVTCPDCDTTFTYCVIEPAILKQAHRDPYRVVPRPTLPARGDNRTCPVARSSLPTFPSICSTARTKVEKPLAHSG